MPKRRGEIVQATIESRFGSLAELNVPLAVFGIVMAMIAPMPSILLDFLVSANITCTISDGKVGIDAKKQIFGNPQPLMLAGSALVAMAAFPDFPRSLFYSWAVARDISDIVFVGYPLTRRRKMPSPRLNPSKTISMRCSKWNRWPSMSDWVL